MGIATKVATHVLNASVKKNEQANSVNQLQVL